MDVRYIQRQGDVTVHRLSDLGPGAKKAAWVHYFESGVAEVVVFSCVEERRKLNLGRRVDRVGAYQKRGTVPDRGAHGLGAESVVSSCGHPLGFELGDKVSCRSVARCKLQAVDAEVEQFRRGRGHRATLEARQREE